MAQRKDVSEVGSSPREEVCRVGYALNAKKLRKSGDGDGDSCAVSTSGVDAKCKGHETFHRVWRGGGLSDIINEMDEHGDPVVDGVMFIAWEWEADQRSQVRDYLLLFICLHTCLKFMLVMSCLHIFFIL